MTRDDSSAEGPVVEASSGNVFADLGLPDAEDMLVKAQLVYEISRVVHDRGLTQTEVAKLLGVTQPDVSRLLRGRMWGYSVGRLLRFLAALGQDVRIVVEPSGRHRPGDGAGRLSVERP